MCSWSLTVTKVPLGCDSISHSILLTGLVPRNRHSYTSLLGGCIRTLVRTKKSPSPKSSRASPPGVSVFERSPNHRETAACSVRFCHANCGAAASRTETCTSPPRRLERTKGFRFETVSDTWHPHVYQL